MKSHTSIKSCIAAAILGLGLSVSAAAQSAPEAEIATGSQGLLGQSYATLEYAYMDLGGISTHADSYTFEFNQPLKNGLDGFFGYNYTQSSVVAGTRVKQNTLAAGLRAYTVHSSWGKPFVEASAGYTWARYSGSKDNSVAWGVAVGSEFQVAPQATVTPYVGYSDAPDLPGEGAWSFGVKGNYWVNTQWAVTAGIARDDDENTLFSVGTNFRF